jgi:hypothetical protein
MDQNSSLVARGVSDYEEKVFKYGYQEVEIRVRL